MRGATLLAFLLLPGGTAAQSSLVQAAMDGDTASARAALQAGARVDEIWLDNTPLAWAASRGHAEVVGLLLAAGARVDQRCGRDGDKTPLRAAASAESVAVFEQLLAAGADPALCADSWDGSVAHIAARSSDGRMIEALARASAALDVNSPRVGGTPLHVAAFGGHAFVVATLLRHGVSVNARGVLGRTPLHLAAQMGHREVVSILLVHGADLELVDDLGRSALHLACEDGHDGVAEELRWDRWTPRPGFDRADSRGWTPSAVAAAFGHTRCLQIVGGDPHSRTAESLRTPLHWAHRARDVLAAERLLELDASRDALDRQGLRPTDLSRPVPEEATAADLAGIQELARRDAGDPSVVVYCTGGYPGIALPETAVHARSGLVLAAWSDGLVVFAPDAMVPDSQMRVSRVDPAAIETVLAVCADLGIFALPDRSEVRVHAASVRVRLLRGGVRRAIEWDRSFARISLPRDSPRRSFENAWILMESELRALQAPASVALHEVARGLLVRGYAPGNLDAPWLR